MPTLKDAKDKVRQLSLEALQIVENRELTVGEKTV